MCTDKERERTGIGRKGYRSPVTFRLRVMVLTEKGLSRNKQKEKKKKADRLVRQKDSENKEQWKAE